MLLDRRSLLMGAAAAALLPEIAYAEARQVPRILLVCQFGTVKSPIAREVLKRRADERHIPVEVTARGITPQQHITPQLLARLRKDGIDPAAEPLMKLGPADVSAADLVIAFDKLPAEYHPRQLEDWSDSPSMVNDYERARSVLDARIDNLLNRLSLPRP